MEKMLSVVYLIPSTTFPSLPEILPVTEQEQEVSNRLQESLCTMVRAGQVSSVAQSCPTLCDPMNSSTQGLPVRHQLPEPTQTHIHWVSDAIQPSHPLSSPSPPALNLSQHQGLFKWVSSSHETARLVQKPRWRNQCLPSPLLSGWNFLFWLNLFACWNLFFGILSPCCLFLNCFTPFFPGFVAVFSKFLDLILGPPSLTTFLANVFEEPESSDNNK